MRYVQGRAEDFDSALDIFLCTLFESDVVFFIIDVHVDITVELLLALTACVLERGFAGGREVEEHAQGEEDVGEEKLHG